MLPEVMVWAKRLLTVFGVVSSYHSAAYARTKCHKFSLTATKMQS